MKKHKFLFVSLDGSHADLAWQVLKEGHQVLYYIDDDEEAKIGDGFVKKTKDWKKHIEWADVIVFENVLGQGVIADKLRRSGKAVIGGTPYTDRLEDDRSFGQQELEKAGVNILPYKEFKDFDEAIAYVRKHPNEYVIKPSGEAQTRKDLLFIGNEEDGSDVLRVLAAYKKTWGDKIKVFQLQEKVTGVEVAVGAFFNGHRFLSPININFEHKRLFSGDVGPSTGEMGTSMFWTRSNKLFNQTLKKIEKKLARERYVGYIDLNCIVNSGGIYPLEFTARFGRPTIEIQTESFITPRGEFLYNLAHGLDEDFKTRKGFSVGVRLAVPPFPYKDKKTFEVYSKNAGIVFKKPNQKEGVHIHDVYQKKGVWAVTGTLGIALCVVGHASTMVGAKEQAYRRIENILIPNMYYRSDISDRWQEDSDRLQSWGYLHEV